MYVVNEKDLKSFLTPMKTANNEWKNPPNKKPQYFISQSQEFNSSQDFRNYNDDMVPPAPGMVRVVGT